MADDENFLSRWSRRKRQAREGARDPEGKGAPPGSSPSPAAAPAHAPAAASAPVAPLAVEDARPLPAVQSLTAESDFSPFMDAKVDGDVRRQALKTLFSDPRFNAMDMLDVYVDDYSKPDPLPDGWLAKLEQAGRLGDRAGRDREEAARDAERLAASSPGPEADGLPGSRLSPPGETLPAEGASPRGEAGESTAADPAIPPLPSRNSVT